MPSLTNAQPWLGIHFSIDDLGLIVETEGAHVLVRTPRGGFRVTYKKSPGYPKLVCESEWLSSAMKKSVGLTHLRARAWRLANDVAKTLGWFSG